MRIILGAVSLLFATPLGAQEKMGESDGPFHAVAIAIPDLKQFDREWAVPDEGAQITSTGELEIGKATYVVVLVGGCQTGDDGQCVIAINYRLLAPDGEPYEGLDGNGTGRTEKVAITRPDAFFHAPHLLGIEIERGNQLGNYTLQTVIEDVLGKHRVETRHVLTAVEK